MRGLIISDFIYFQPTVFDFIDENALTGNIPSEIGMLTSLTILELCECEDM